ncbi:hypothetical protein PSU4_40470 [Pseudonocardia sulfidoxydans NBRC 16205]|uniref:STAS domain-containing protein n=1 Tax=Pseudonocardia sulfidoxydans NBRC 16205 TaxID=1223511 RepID=A0A511DLF2_9PSEU|nr:hypothetical protein [Pseudonocardia sulfidoxydans]GEL25093.1 hypothetical protein PSU4_40470 [Pseudonocardia sulfidoxydans NBRC 16205]
MAERITRRSLGEFETGLRAVAMLSFSLLVVDLRATEDLPGAAAEALIALRDRLADRGLAMKVVSRPHSPTATTLELAGVAATPV